MATACPRTRAATSSGVGICSSRPQPPVIVEGPFVYVGDVLATVRFVTDVDTRATVFFGTQGGTYGTADEF